MYDTLIQAGQKWTHSIKTAVTCIHIFQRNILFKNENTHMIKWQYLGQTSKCSICSQDSSLLDSRFRSTRCCNWLPGECIDFRRLKHTCSCSRLGNILLHSNNWILGRRAVQMYKSDYCGIRPQFYLSLKKSLNTKLIQKLDLLTENLLFKES